MNDSGINPNPTDPRGDEDPPQVDPGLLARRLDALFVEHQVSNSHVARQITASGTKVSHGYLSLLRKGLRDKPSADKLQAIADFFNVTTEYFTGPNPNYRHEEVAEVMAIANAERIRAIAHHASGLSPESIEIIHQMIATARKAEGLPPIDARPSQSDDAQDGPDFSSSESSVD